MTGLRRHDLAAADLPAKLAVHQTDIQLHLVPAISCPSRQLPGESNTYLGSNIDDAAAKASHATSGPGHVLPLVNVD